MYIDKGPCEIIYTTLSKISVHCILSWKINIQYETHFYTKTGVYTFHNLYRNFCDFLHYCNCVWDFFITEKSIIYALIKYNKFGSTFKKKLYTTNKTDIISTNSFPIIEKK